MPKCRSAKLYGEIYKCTNEGTHKVRHLETRSQYVITVCSSHVRYYKALNAQRRAYKTAPAYDIKESN